MKLFRYLAFLLLVIGLLPIPNPQPAKAASASAWNAGRIIDDAVFNNKNAMSVADIQSFLNSKVPVCDTNHPAGGSNQGAQPPWTCLKDYYENTSTKANNLNGQPVPAGAISAAQIIYNHAQQFNLNPQVILVTLQKENGLITDTWPYPWQYRTAMGFACPDSAACDPAYFGFNQQVYQGARHLRNFADGNPAWFIPFSPGVNFIQYNPNSGCGGSNVTIANGATAALYSYTPYQPNASALSNLYGSGDGCGAYGNRNFWRDFTDWFGTTLSYVAQFAGQSSFPTIQQGSSTTVFIKYKNAGGGAWYDDTSLGSAPDGTMPVHLATARPINRASAFGTGWNADKNRPANNFSRVFEANGTTLTTNQHVVQPGQIAEFSFTLSAPSNQAIGSYVEYFQPIVEGTIDGLMNDVGSYLVVTVPKTYIPQFVSQSAFPTMTKSTTAAGMFRYKNIGNTAWYDDASLGSAPAGTKPVHLATAHQTNRASVFGSGWGPDKNRPANNFSKVFETDGTTLASNQHVVQPGQIGEFSFTFAAPFSISGGTYQEFFKPVVEGMPDSTVPDPNTYLTVTVQSYLAQYSGQSDFPSLVAGNSAAGFFKYKNVGNAAWYDDTSLGSAPAGTKPVHLATSNPTNRASVFGDDWGVNKNRPANDFGAVYESDGTTLASNQHVVQPGQIARFNFTFDAPSGMAAGAYKEHFKPVLETAIDGTFNDPGTYLTVTVGQPAYSVQFAGQSSFPTVARGNTATGFFKYKNVGNVAWYDDASLGSAPAGTKPMHLATSRPTNRASIFGDNWGAHKNRPANNLAAVYESDGTTLASNQHVVQPGQIGKYSINFDAPSGMSTGAYQEFFKLVLEGANDGTANDPGTYLTVTVQ
jgi:hypothetical protein